jgi:IS5 family transposase
MNTLFADIILTLTMLSILILTAIAAAKVKKIRDGKILVVQRKQRLYRKAIYRFAEYRRKKKREQRRQQMGKIKVPAIHA